MKKRMLLGLALATLLQSGVAYAEPNKKMSSALPRSMINVSKGQNTEQRKPLVQIALLLDTSGSMEGLIDQARYQLWNVVSDLAKARTEGEPIRLEISVYQYGTELVSKSKNCLRQIVPFTDNIDDVSKGLFSLHVGGGDEYCGAAIDSALNDLAWSESKGVYKAIFIAGNEYFDQGSTTFGQTLPELKSKSIFVNTIYCGTKYDGQSQWDTAAGIAGGVASLIDHNHHLPNMPTPYDEVMRELNDEMNATFVWYGSGGEKASRNQEKQDKNADRMSDHAFAARMATKAGHLYHHVNHDLVDAMQHRKVNLSKMPEKLMPVALRDKSPSDRADYMDEMIDRRKSVRRKMAEVLSKRQRYLENEYLKKKGGAKTMLGDALSMAIQEQAGSLGYTFDESGLVATNAN